MSWYSVRTNPGHTLRDVYAKSDIYDGRPVSIGSEAIVAGLRPGGFVMLERDTTLVVHAAIDSSALGQFVQVRGVFHRDGRLDVEAVRVARGRRWKMIVSVLPALWVAWLLATTFRFNLRNFCFRPRSHA